MASNSILTQTQREYLLGKQYDKDDSERMTRRRIRQRLSAAMWDLNLIVNNLPIDDIEKSIPKTDGVNDEEGGFHPIEETNHKAISLLYLAYRQRETLPDHEDGWHLEQLVDEGIRDALTRLGVDAEKVEVDISIERGEELRALVDADDLDDVPDEMLLKLWKADDITQEEFFNAVDA